MIFDVITVFPKIFDSYFNESILKRAQKRGLIKIRAHDLRAYTCDRHHKTDDAPYGGGAGMVMMAEPILHAVEGVIKKHHLVIRPGARQNRAKPKIILFSAKGKQFNQKMAYDWAKQYHRIIFVTGRYEGIDERVSHILKKTYKKDFIELSIGPYVLTDGDAAAMAVVSAVARLIPGVIRTESLQEESHCHALLESEPKLLTKLKKLQTTNYQLSTRLEYPHYTRPETLIYPPSQKTTGVSSWMNAECGPSVAQRAKEGASADSAEEMKDITAVRPWKIHKGRKYRVPRVLLSGNHAAIQAWRKDKMK